MHAPTTIPRFASLLFACLFAATATGQEGRPATPATPAAPAAPAPRDEKAVSKEQAAAIAALKQQFEKKQATVSKVLADPANMDLHDKLPFRELLRDHATAEPVVMTTKDEAGAKLHLEGRVVDAAQKPVAGALVYAYHTDTRGFYGYERAHVGGNPGDFGHARLFAYCRTDANGAFQLQTIRPASYPNTDLPQHVHFEVTAKGMASLVTECFFADDPKLDAKARVDAAKHDVPIVELLQDKAGIWRGRCELALQPERK